jgi:hypothetical protein
MQVAVQDIGQLTDLLNSQRRTGQTGAWQQRGVPDSQAAVAGACSRARPRRALLTRPGAIRRRAGQVSGRRPGGGTAVCPGVKAAGPADRFAAAWAAPSREGIFGRAGLAHDDTLGQRAGCPAHAGRPGVMRKSAESPRKYRHLTSSGASTPGDPGVRAARKSRVNRAESGPRSAPLPAPESCAGDSRRPGRRVMVPEGRALPAARGARGRQLR